MPPPFHSPAAPHSNAKRSRSSMVAARPWVVAADKAALAQDLSLPEPRTLPTVSGRWQRRRHLCVPAPPPPLPLPNSAGELASLPAWSRGAVTSASWGCNSPSCHGSRAQRAAVRGILQLWSFPRQQRQAPSARVAPPTPFSLSRVPAFIPSIKSIFCALGSGQPVSPDNCNHALP
jgi:hypothetical protein